MSTTSTTSPLHPSTTSRSCPSCTCNPCTSPSPLLKPNGIGKRRDLVQSRHFRTVHVEMMMRCGRKLLQCNAGPILPLHVTLFNRLSLTTHCLRQRTGSQWDQIRIGSFGYEMLLLIMLIPARHQYCSTFGSEDPSHSGSHVHCCRLPFPWLHTWGEHLDTCFQHMYQYWPSHSILKQ